MSDLKTVKEIINEAFVGKRVRFPGLSQAFEREEVHTIEKVRLDYEGGEDEDAPESWSVSPVFYTSKAPGLGGATQAWVYYDLTGPVEFVTGECEKNHTPDEVYSRPECLFHYCPTVEECEGGDRCLTAERQK